MIDNSHLTMHQCIFKENTATYVGGATYIQNSHSLFESCIFEKNKVNSVQQNANGGAISATGANTDITIKQCLFKGNTATYLGGATHIQSSHSLFESCIFEKNKAYSLQQNASGGAISATGANTDITIKQCLFKGNTATYSGGAIIMVKTRGIFVNCTFEKNSAESSLQRVTFGGAVCALDNSDMTMHQCGFKDNIATGTGGATFIQNSHSLFESCIFEKNKAYSLQQNVSGGAISATGANTDITIKQWLFKGNTATYSGGAIKMLRTRGIFVNCTFEKNSVESSLQSVDFGGAVCVIDNSHLTMHQCIFKENTATYVGGATHIQNSHSLFESCIFEKNKVNSLQQNVSGGAISATGANTDITIKQCLFKGNTATYSGGAIKMQRTRGIFVNCTFEKNSVESSPQSVDFGGAVCVIDNSHLTMHQCIFKENTATYVGGATYIQNSHSLFESCIFEKNKVNSVQQNANGGAISATGANTDITIKQCLFKGNTATYLGGATHIQNSHSLFESCIFEKNNVNNLQQNASGGAISATGANTDITIKQCLFKGNTATYSGGAIHMQKTRGIFVNCTFEKNSAESSLQRVAFGGAVCVIDNSHLTMHQCIFKENTATYVGGATYIQNSHSLFESCIFEKNKVSSLQQNASGGAIIAAGANTDITIKQCFFRGNTATYSGGAIEMQRTRGIFVNCTFEKNSAESSLQRVTFGGAVCALDNSDMTMHQCGFKDNIATGTGGATFIQNSHSLFESCIFEKNKAYSLQQNVSGGAISATGANTDITIKQWLFKGNTATYSGGAIKMLRTRGIFVNCTFEKNSVESSLQSVDFGGAVCVIDNSHLTMHQCIFKENTATYVGGATHIQNSHSLFESCIFEKNKVNSLQQNVSGGAISATGANTDITIKQCLFKGNTATDSGGAIKMQRTRGIFVNCTFEKNSVESSLQSVDFGGAVCVIDNSHLTMHQCIFKENTATYVGGATYIQNSHSLFESCIFEKNKVNSVQQNANGGAISATGANTDITIKQCLFKGNTATYSGGAIKMQRTRGIFVNCTFEKNSVESSLQSVDFGGAVCVIDNSHLTMHQCIFKENTATYVGGATYIQNSHSLFESCIFEKNKVNSVQQNANGGAISATGANTDITIKQCLFKGNTATYLGGATHIQNSHSLFESCIFEKNNVNNLQQNASGGAISATGANTDITIKQCLFKGNTVTYSGGAIHMQKTRGIFVNCTFEKNSAESSLQRVAFGGAVCALDNSDLTMHQCGFKDNTATGTGGATFILNSHSLFESCIFEKNKVSSLQQNASGGAIIAAGANTDITIKQCFFRGNTATYSGGAIIMVKTRGIFVNCTFEKNSAESSLQRVTFGGAVCALDNSDMTMHQCGFKDNIATGTGGATFIQNSHSLFESCIFEKNKAYSLQQNVSGGAISATGANTDITIKQWLFKGNTATYSGGAIKMLRTRGIFVNCTFEKNSVESSLQSVDFGGAVCVIDNSHLTMHQCIFKENTATYVGGATHIQNSHSLFESCIFEKNKVNSLQQNVSGGAISATGANTDITIKRCLFKGNTATYSGGAIKMQRTRGIFVNCTFEKNSVESSLQSVDFGGAVCVIDNSHLTMHQCIFKENTATYVGGATYIQNSHSLFESCIFEKNKVSNSGGAITATYKSAGKGGACGIQQSQSSFENCTFEGKV